MTNPPVPFTVIGGFLGAGKTTLVNGLLRQAHGERITVLVNDFGSVSIDADLIESHDGDTIALANGCICCSIGGEFAAAIPAVLDASPRPDRVIVEASGIAEPRKIAQYGTLPGFRLDGVVVLADAEAIRDLCADPRIGAQVRGQLAQGDILVLTKVDLLGGPAARDEVRRWLAHEHPGGRIVEASHGEVATDLLLDRVDLDRHATQAWDGFAMSGPDAMARAPGSANHAFDTATVDVPGPIGRADLEAWLDALPREVIRVKGLVRLDERPDAVATVHRVGARVRIAYDAPPVAAGSAGRLVLIAAGGGDGGAATRAATWTPLS